jgi:hypothetical protein
VAFINVRAVAVYWVKNWTERKGIVVAAMHLYRYRIFLRKSRSFLRLYRIFLRFEITTGFFSGCTGFFSGIPVECTRLFSTVLWSVRKHGP